MISGEARRQTIRIVAVVADELSHRREMSGDGMSILLSSF
jgi:hypothetical protein